MSNYRQHKGTPFNPDLALVLATYICNWLLHPAPTSTSYPCSHSCHPTTSTNTLHLWLSSPAATCTDGLSPWTTGTNQSSITLSPSLDCPHSRHSIVIALSSQTCLVRAASKSTFSWCTSSRYTSQSSGTHQDTPGHTRAHQHAGSTQQMTILSICYHLQILSIPLVYCETLTLKSNFNLCHRRL